MKFLKSDGEHLIFHLGKREKGMLLDLLKMYPVIPEGHFPGCSDPDRPGAESNQVLLVEALSESRAESKRMLEALLAAPHRFQDSSSGVRLSLTAPELEWLLQVLNDIRVGSWLILGSPDERKGKPLRLEVKTARHLWAMDLSGQFQHALLSGYQASS